MEALEKFHECGSVCRLDGLGAVAALFPSAEHLERLFGAGGPCGVPAVGAAPFVSGLLPHRRGGSVPGEQGACTAATRGFLWRASALSAPCPRGRLCGCGPVLYARESQPPGRAPECAGRTYDAKLALERCRPPFPGPVRRTQSRALPDGSAMRAPICCGATCAMPRLLPGHSLPNHLCGFSRARAPASPAPQNGPPPRLCRSGVSCGRPFCDGQHQESPFGRPALCGSGAPARPGSLATRGRPLSLPALLFCLTVSFGYQN